MKPKGWAAVFYAVLAFILFSVCCVVKDGHVVFGATVSAMWRSVVQWWCGLIKWNPWSWLTLGILLGVAVGAAMIPKKTGGAKS